MDHLRWKKAIPGIPVTGRECTLLICLYTFWLILEVLVLEAGDGASGAGRCPD
jgi:hypothetical protein